MSRPLSSVLEYVHGETRTGNSKVCKSNTSLAGFSEQSSFGGASIAILESMVHEVKQKHFYSTDRDV